jgi:hypothetical protein
VRLIGFTGGRAADRAVLAKYLCSEYGFVSCAAADLSGTFYLHCCEDPRPLVVPDIAGNVQAEFVRRRGLLIHLSRPQASAVSQSTDPGSVFYQIDDVRLSAAGSAKAFKAQVDELLLTIKRWGMYGG